MEHFEMHKEQLEDLIVELQTNGPKVFENITINDKPKRVTMSDFALLDEMSGLTTYLDNFML